MGSWMGHRVEVWLGGQYTLDGRLDQAQTRSLLDAFDDYDIFGKPRVFCPEGAEYEYDFRRMKQMRVDDRSRCRSFRIITAGEAARVRCMRPAPPSQHSLHTHSLPARWLALASLHYPTRLQVAAAFGGA